MDARIIPPRLSSRRKQRGFIINPYNYASGGGGGGGPEETMFGSGVPSVTQFSFGATLGMRFYADVDGIVTRLRFLCAPSQVGSGVVTLDLWTDAGANLASDSITSPASDWNEVTLASPVSITASSVYVVSYHTSTSFNVYDTTLSSPINNTSHLFSAASGNNGVYKAGVFFPDTSGAGQNYYADIVFEPTI